MPYGLMIRGILHLEGAHEMSYENTETGLQKIGVRWGILRVFSPVLSHIPGLMPGIVRVTRFLSALYHAFFMSVMSARARIDRMLRAIETRRLRKIALGITPAFGIMPMTTSSSTISGSSIFNSIWNLLMSGFKSVLNVLIQAFGSVMSGFTGGLNIMWTSWGFSLTQYGIWSPLIVVVSLAVAGFVAYLFFDVYGIEKDILGGEEAL